MSGERRYWVTPGADRAYRVELRPIGDGWQATVERDGERWAFPILAGDRPGEVWSEGRPIRYRWDPVVGRLALDGWIHDLAVESDVVHRMAEFGIAAGSRGGVNPVRAPMPGLVMAIEVAEGEDVQEGQGLMIIEAMKMENEIRAPAAGILRRLSVSIGDVVERGALLCEVAPPREDA